METIYTGDGPPEFRAWPKTPRLYREMIVTEKIDGTNACVIIHTDGRIYAQSRNRLLAADGNDNHGFHAWCLEHQDGLADTLGFGRHYGEWWGQGIQRNYGLDHKRFSLFNTARFDDAITERVPGLGVVPVLFEGTFNTAQVQRELRDLTEYGSRAAPGWPTPEGVVVFHTASRQVYKSLIENDQLAKSDLELRA